MTLAKVHISPKYLTLYSVTSYANLRELRGYSSVGRALQWH